MEELRVSVRDGIKEERSFFYDSMSKLDNKIFDLAQRKNL